MCGIVGFVALHRGAFESAPELLGRQLRHIETRGPDSVGTWLSERDGVAFGHRRLAIVDLSSAGHQPMLSSNGRFVIVFNGEIYNHLELRAELEREDAAPTWLGHSDTETLIAAINAWGVRVAVERSVGMFAFAVFDQLTRTLTLGRDRFGEKPLYFAEVGHGSTRRFAFGSDLKAISDLPGFSADTDHAAVSSLLQFGYIPAPQTVYQSVFKAEPGTLLTLDTESGKSHIERYWSPVETATSARQTQFSGSDEDAINALEAVLCRAVDGQMVADVPLGAFLSGGVDSTMIVALMTRRSASKVKTFTIGFEESSFNEAKHARQTARHFGTEHTEYYLSDREALEIIPKMPSLYTEPFGDASQIPTFLVAQLARRHVTVSLSGDAGDEVFGGYNRYLFAHRAWNKLQRVPSPVRAGLSRLFSGVSQDTLERIGTLYASAVDQRGQVNNFADKAGKAIRVLNSRSASDLYRRTVSLWHPPVMDGYSGHLALDVPIDEPGVNAVIDSMMLFDTINYLPGDILNKVDRACMGNSLEGRIPFLDHRVYEFAWSLPMRHKIRNGETKWLLRKLLDRYIPRPMMERPKMGFALPLAGWLRGPLRDWAENLLAESHLKTIEHLDIQRVRAAWLMHLSGKRNLHEQLWPLLMYQAWRYGR